ncbi:MAG: DUF2569 family protein [Halomonas sp.]|uniref:DUF2569 family protein n=1 Tax=Halomonas sp. TaxID=1486246 RepID=UPI002ACEDD8E|nr:DUF2569 family protein [Halomonas sp.]MDZ7852334.1 DUF2569 family protein [Halomonas sp.]
MFCPQCGKAMATTDAKFCHACGSRLPQDGAPEEAPLQGEAPGIERGQRQAAQPSGVRGWLLVLVGVLMIVVPLIGIGSFLSHLAILKHLYPSLVGESGWEQYLLWMWLAVGGTAGLSIYASLRLLNGKTSEDVEAVCTMLWVIGPVAAVVVNALIPYLVSIKTILIYDYIGLTGTPLIASIIGSSLFSLIWTSYLNHSRRVRNTYLQPQAEPQGASQ